MMRISKLLLFPFLWAGLVLGGCDRHRHHPDPAPGLSDVNTVTRIVNWQGESGEATVATVTVGFFHERGLALYLGRGFIPTDVENRAVVLSYEYWQRAMAGRPEIVAKELSIDDETAVVVGVLPEGVGGEIDIFEPEGLWSSRGRSTDGRRRRRGQPRGQRPKCTRLPTFPDGSGSCARFARRPRSSLVEIRPRRIRILRAESPPFWSLRCL